MPPSRPAARAAAPGHWLWPELATELHALKIDLCLRQQGLDTTTPAGKSMFQMLGVFAEFERAMIAERVRAGLARARGESKRLGRPQLPRHSKNES
jgi:DNA invertase Pin-like site-specific DNA recombinase